MSILNRNRLSVYSRVFIVLYVVVILALLLFRNGLLDPMGKPIGTDFLAHYAGSWLALNGEAASAYDNDRIRDVEADVIGSPPPPLYWLYPPTYFLFIWPLAFFPYLPALAGWMALTCAGYVAVVRRIFPDRLTVPLTLAFPGTLQNLLQGQNGFLSALLMGGGLLLLRHRPLWGGFVLGLTSYKPHLSVLVPIALVVGREWLAVLGYIGGAVGLMLVSFVVFGADVWSAYVEKMMFAGQVLQQGGAPLFKAPTTFALTRLMGADLATARAFQAVVSVAAAAAVIWIWARASVPFALKAAALVIGGLLFTPSAYDYDLAILAVPIAWIVLHMSEFGRDRTQEWVLVVAWLTPVAVPIVAAATNAQFGPVVLAAMLWVVLRRVQASPR